MVKPRKDLTGMRFGKLVVLKQAEDYVSPKNQVHNAQWLCQCDCGNQTKVLGTVLNRPHGTKSCGCISKEFIRTLTKPRYDLTGERYGRLVVLNRAEDDVSKQGKHYSQWLCQCDCGNQIVVRQGKLIQGRTKSCGCIRKEVTSEIRSAQLVGKKFGKLTVVKRSGSFIDKNGNKKSSRWLCECDCGGKKFARASELLSGDTLSCGCLISMGEDKIASLLRENNINYKHNYWFDDLRTVTNTPLYFDFAILDIENNLICLIEYQGEQHYLNDPNIQFGKLQREITDDMKREYCKNNNILLHEIKYDENIEEAFYRIISFTK